MSYEHKPSIVLAELWERESKAGRQYFSGFMGAVSVVLLRDGERPHPTRPDETIVVWKLLVQERQPRPAAQKPPASPPERDEAPMPAAQRPPSLARVLGARSRRSGATGRRARRSANGWPARWRRPTGSRLIPTIRCRSRRGNTFSGDTCVTSRSVEGRLPARAGALAGAAITGLNGR